MTIIFYDFQLGTADAPWNPNTWKVRYTLNYKGLPFRTERLQYVDIEKTCKEKGIPPSNPDGEIKYTLPSIFDTSTGTGVSESHRIAAYLDETYPDTPKVIPAGTEALQTAWIAAIRPNLSAMWQFSLPGTLNILDHPESNDYFYRTRSVIFGKDLHEMRPQGEVAWDAAMKDLEKGFNVIDQWILKSGGPYVMGKTVSFADFVVAGWLNWLQATVGKDSREWQLIGTWNAGRWDKRLEQLAKYSNPQ
ncbi:hypothetical protein APHAL10511_003036 [Amanita phalloides]|nr:hypothetical protein APHAL10511_003036 [Amanita phalloides]